MTVAAVNCYFTIQMSEILVVSNNCFSACLHCCNLHFHGCAIDKMAKNFGDFLNR